MTILFADLKGSMELLADRDPEDARRLIDPVLEQMIEAVHRYEGTVNQVLGDGIMALFGAPLAHEDHAVRAAYAALTLQESIRRYSDGLLRAGGVPLQARVGINSGEVVVRAIRNDLHVDYTAVGQTTHLAARMEQMAVPGSILLTRETLRRAEGYLETRPLGPIPIKGLTDPVEVYELLGASAARSRLQAAAARGLTRFVARELERAQLGEALQLAGANHGQVVALVGEAGVGKSRLGWELRHSEAGRTWLVVEGGALSFGRPASYRPIAGLLQSYFQIEAGEPVAVMRERIARRLLDLGPAPEAAMPALLALLDTSYRDARWESLEPPRRRLETLNCLKWLFLRQSQIQPVLVLFEDLHWIDADTQSFLDTLVDSVPTARILLLVTYRPEYSHRWSGKTYYRQIPVEPLSDERAEQVLGALLGDQPSLQPLKQFLVRRTGGNPLFLEESVHALLETHVLVGRAGDYRVVGPLDRASVPPTVHAVLATRIDRLAAHEKHLLQVAAVIDGDVPHALLRAISGLDDDALELALRRLCSAEFLYESQFFPAPEYTFKHALTHEVAYASLLHEHRRALHAKTVAAIEELFGERLDSYVDALAHHAFHGGMWQKAIGYLRSAAERAFGRTAYSVAVALLEQGLTALEHLPATPERARDSIDLRLELRDALVPLGELARVLRVLRETEELAGEHGERPRLGRTYAFLTNYMQVAGDPEAGIEYGRRALAISSEEPDQATDVVATAFLASAYHAVGNYEQALAFAHRNMSLLHGDLVRQRFGMANLPSVYSRVVLVRALAERGDFSQAIGHGLDALKIAEDAHHPLSLTLAWFGMGYLHLRQGGVDNAIAALERAVELARVGNPIWFQQIAAWLASAYAARGRTAEAFAIVDRAAEQARQIALVGATHGHGIGLLARGEALLEGGRLDEACIAAKEAVEFLTRIHGRGYVAWAQRLLGEISARRVPLDPEEGERCFIQSRATAEALGMRPLVAHCRLGLGRLRAAQGRATESRRDLEGAVDLFRELEMETWAKRAEVELGSLKPVQV